MAKKTRSYTYKKNSFFVIFCKVYVLRIGFCFFCCIIPCLLLFNIKVAAQSLFPATNNPHIIALCGQGCTNIKLKSTNIKSSKDYLFKETSYNPYSYTANNGIEDSTFYDNFNYSRAFNLPFPVCFYDSLFTNFVVNPLGTITFDISNANCDVTYGWYLPLPGFGVADYPCNTGTYCYYPRATIMGIGTPLNPNINNDGSNFPVSPADRKVEYRVEGVAPLRKLIVSYYKIGTYADTACSRFGKFATFQMAIQESTGFIEINIENFSCPAIETSSGEAICGIQNWARDKATTAPGKNATVWTAFHESYQFIPSGSSSRFINAKLLDMNGSLIAIADTATSTDSSFINISFNNICPINDTTQYVVQHNYGGCQPFSVYDTVMLIRNNNIVIAANTSSTCAANGTITMNGSGDNFKYALDGGLPQNNNVFTNAAVGNHFIEATGINTTCSRLLPVTVIQPSLLLQTRSDTAICQGEAVTLNTMTDAVSFSWQPAAKLNDAAIASPTARPDASTSYVVTAQAGSCTAKDTVNITVFPGLAVNAGNDITILNGDDAQLAAVADNWINLLWSPPDYLTAVNKLNPVAVKPAQSVLYRITATNQQGCIGTDEVQVTVLANCLKVNNAFSPNGDGVNETWIVYNGFDCLQNIQAAVYNRYGSKVYESKNYRNEWKGTYHNKPLPDGTYYYVLTVQLITGRTYEVKGDVTILR